MKKHIPIVSIFFALSVASHSAIIVNYDSPATGTVNALRTGTVTGTGQNQVDLAFDSTTALFNGSGQNQRFYGGIHGRYVSGTVATGTDLFGSITNQLQSGTPGIFAGVVKADPTAQGPNNGVAISARGMAVWDSADFLGHSSGNTYTFDNTSSMTVNISTFLNSPGSNTGLFFVIRNANSYFRSAEEYNLGAIGTGQTFNGSALTWLALDPTLLADFAGTTGGGSAQTFSDVTGVGFIYRTQRASAPSSEIRISDFQANLSVIPEPSSAILLGLSALGFVGYRRRK